MYLNARLSFLACYIGLPIIVSILLSVPPVTAQPTKARQASLVVHEWGTITTKHNPSGEQLGQLNKIEPTEILPSFVHKFEPSKPAKATPFGKSAATPGHPDVTMRLETPVIYFYPSEPRVGPPIFDVSVKFRGGIINEFFPNATSQVQFDFERIRSKQAAGTIKSWDGLKLDDYVLGSLVWKNVSFSKKAVLPDTGSPIWLAPRAVQSTPIEVGAMEGEKYLFYRGVAHLKSLLQTTLSGSILKLSPPEFAPWLATNKDIVLSKIWVVKISKEGQAAFRSFDNISISGVGAKAASISADFDSSDFIESKENLAELRSSIKTALEVTGLFPDEAEAMLKTWESSYFGQPGKRVFYVVPRAWTDYFLPLQISIPHELTRVILGRIDLM